MTNTKTTFAVVGCGRWGLNHLRAATTLFGKDLKFACDVDQETEKNTKRIAPDARFVTRIEDILADRDVDAVVISTPSETHYSVARMCLEAGKNILVEKPLALSSGHAKELDRLAAERSKTLMVGHVLLYHPAIRKIKDLINGGTVGQLQYIYSNRLNLGTVRKEENILWSFAPHDISVLDYLIEEDPIEVDAWGAIFLQPGIHDVTLTTLRYPRNVHAHIHVSWLHPFKEHRLVVIGDRSMIVFEDSRQENKLLLCPKGIDQVAGVSQKRDLDCIPIEYSREEPLKLELRHFAECVAAGKPPISGAKNGIKVLEILERAQAKLEEKEARQIGQELSV